VQFIDVRDAAAFMLAQAEAARRDVFNLTGPAEPLTMGSFFDAACAALGPEATLHWIDEATLLQAGVAPWTELPLWVPADSAGLHVVDLVRARASGLMCRPLIDTLRDTAAWAAKTPQPVPPNIGLDPRREAALLAH
jgi:2'-hydroxyisoflavone reductase